MPKRTGTVTRQALVTAPLPEATDTYTVISHGSIINHTLRILHEKGFQVVDEIYKCSENAQIALGIFKIQYDQDPDMAMMFAFANSYNKSMRFKCAIGGYVYANNASVVSGNMMNWGRKHTGTADEEAANTIETQIENAEAYFKQLVADKEAMKNVTLTKTEFAELLGVLYLEDEMLTAEQLRIVKAEYKKPQFHYNGASDSLWVLYNHILVALAKSHPRTWMDQQKVVHFKLLERFNLTQFDEDETTVDDTPANMTSESEEMPIVYNNKPDPMNPVKITFDHAVPAVVINQLDLAKQAEAVEELGVSNISELTPEQEEKVTEKAKPILPGYQIGKTILGERNEAGDVLESGHTRIIDFSDVNHMTDDQLQAAQYPKSIEDAFENLDPESVETLTEAEFQERYGLDQIQEVEEGDQPEGEALLEPIQETDIFMSRSDLLSIDPDAAVDGVVLLMDEAYEIIRAGEQHGIDGFFLRKIEDEEEVITESPVQPTAIPENAIRMHQEDFAEVSGLDPVAGAQVDIEGHHLEVHSIDGESVILVPYVPWKGDEAPSLPVEPADYDFNKTVQDMDQEEDDDWEKFGAKEIPYVAPQEPEKYIAGTDPISEDAPVQVYPVDPQEEDLEEQLDLASKQMDAVRTVISQELYDLYGTIPTYEFVLEDGQYNVTLSTGEVVVLLQHEIDSRATVL
jgi:hypothetical protein